MGKTGIAVKILGFGGLPLQRIPEEQAIKLVRHSYERGINFFDTARGYITSEERIGKALKEVREEVIIATKDRVQSNGDEMLQKIHQSLKELQTDYIDIYQLHHVSLEKDWEKLKNQNDILKVLLKAREEGIIRHLGITSHNPKLLIKILEEDLFETVMIPYNYLTTEPEEKLFSICRKKKLGIIIMKPLAGGVLSNANTALKYILQKDVADVVIPGMTNIAEVNENVSIASGPFQLTNMDLSQIKKDKIELGNNFCRWCDYCQICPQKIPISFILRMERQFPDEKNWTENTSKVMNEAIKKAATCVECRLCENICPYNLEIVDMLPKKALSLNKKLTSYLSYTREKK